MLQVGDKVIKNPQTRISAKGIFADKENSQDLSDDDWQLIEQELAQLSKDCEAHILQEWEESQREF